MESRRLNLEVAKAVSELEEAMQKFELKNILYKIIFRGRGLEFDSYRNYDTTDDASSIDWKASKRANKLLVKQYIEERDLKVIFLIDASENMVFGSTEKLKCEYAAELSAALAHLVLNNNDNIGFILYNRDVVKFVPPNKGVKQFQLFVDELSDAVSYTGNSGIEKALDFLLSNSDESISAIVMVSDFLNINPSQQKMLGLIGNRFETIAIMVKDPLDKSLPDVNAEVLVEHPVTHERILINPKIFGKVYEKIANEQEESVKRMFEQSGIDLLSLTTDQSFVIPLVEFLKERIVAGKRRV
ncbi:MAG TPA: DUF58 domain-containing protein [Candidatus Pacearchaeota archaeon]|nr:DUF58 domain-containing protein [Candidatus Pacearchaeota archaeon]